MYACICVCVCVYGGGGGGGGGPYVFISTWALTRWGIINYYYYNIKRRERRVKFHDTKDFFLRKTNCSVEDAGVGSSGYKTNDSIEH